NEAMKQYARQRSYGAGASRTPFPGGRGAGEGRGGEGRTGEGTSPPSSGHAPHAGGYQSVAPNAPTNPVPPPPGMRGSGLPAPPPLPRQPTPLPPPPGGGMGGGMGGMGGMSGAGGMAGMMGGGANGGFAPQQTASAALNVIYNGEKLPITKDRFVIGRGKQS